MKTTEEKLAKAKALLDDCLHLFTELQATTWTDYSSVQSSDFDEIISDIEEFIESVDNKTKWNFPEQGELPENKLKVYCVDHENNHKIGFHKDYDKPNMFVDSDGRYFYCIAWTELLNFP